MLRALFKKVAKSELLCDDDVLSKDLLKKSHSLICQRAFSALFKNYRASTFKYPRGENFN